MNVARTSDFHFENADEIEFTREQLDFGVDRWLRSRGWKSTCETPGSYWVWLKQIDGHEYLVDRSHAVSIQRHMDARECSCSESARDKKCVAHGGED